LIDRLSWLHVSDFHFKGSGDRFSQTVACEALLKDVVARAEQGTPLSFVLVSGDIAHSAQPDEYAQGAEFMSKLSASLSIDPSRFFFVPGNHDVDRTLHDFAQIGAKQVLRSQSAVDQALGDAARMKDLTDRQAAYRAFVEEFTGGQERTATPDGLGYVSSITVEAVTVALVGLNSAWLCGPSKEEKALIIGERQLIAALALVRDIDPQLVLAMTHHPLEWLAEWDQSSCRARLLDSAHILHRGHLHQADVVGAPHRKCLLVAAGSAHTSRFYPNSYNIVSIDLGVCTSIVQEYRYQLDDGVFEPAEVIRAPCELGGQIPGDVNELAHAITAAVAAAAPYAGYMAALLLGEKEEIPLRIDGRLMFIASGMARDSDPEQAATALDFLTLRNLLRLHRSEVTLAERVAEQTVRIELFAGWLTERAETDEDCCARLMARSGTPSQGTEMPYTEALLRELHASEDWELLEAQARRAAASADPATARLARGLLAEALMHSDEPEKREQAVVLAEQLTAESAATVEDFLLAAAASEVNEAPQRSITLATEALGRWPESARLTSYARGLSTRTGDHTLRALIDTRGEPGG
jgi:predicted MPP superfamily phosphohydrolase